MSDPASLTAELMEWLVGVALGRFDVRLATGERGLPAEPEPFDPLPICSPGMLTGEEGLPTDAPPPGYSIGFPADGVLVDDAGHDRDLIGRTRQVFRCVFAEQEAFIEELRAFREEVARVAPLWNPNVDDGVIINFAPLWRLVPQHRPWQKECKDCWDKLMAGDYDWAHLAMHLWPERVVPKCGKDRSLAIAHGLEDLFWEESSVASRQPSAGDAFADDRRPTTKYGNRNHDPSGDHRLRRRRVSQCRTLAGRVCQ